LHASKTQYHIEKKSITYCEKDEEKRVQCAETNLSSIWNFEFQKRHLETMEVLMTDEVDKSLTAIKDGDTKPTKHI